MSYLPIIEIVGRKILGRRIPGSIPLVQHLTLWIAFIGAAFAARSDRLLALSTKDFLPDWLHPRVQFLTSALGAAVAARLVIASLDFVLVEKEAGDLIAFGIPIWVALCVMPMCFALIAARSIWRSADKWQKQLVASLGLTIPIAIKRRRLKEMRK